MNDALAGVSDVVDKVTRLDEEVKSFETGKNNVLMWNPLYMGGGHENLVDFQDYGINRGKHFELFSILGLTGFGVHEIRTRYFCGKL